jgi:hypothetical protein
MVLEVLGEVVEVAGLIAHRRRLVAPLHRPFRVLLLCMGMMVVQRHTLCLHMVHLEVEGVLLQDRGHRELVWLVMAEPESVIS